jgi:hypothetical protein
MLRFLRPPSSAWPFLLLILAGCDSFPVAIQNQTDAEIIVRYVTLDRKCDLAESQILILAPGERFAIRCSPKELINVTIVTKGGHKCSLSKHDIVAKMKEEKGFKGAFLLPLQDC